MEDPFQPFLKRSGVVVLDGALATELERRGADLSDSLWSAKVLMEAPDLIREVHRDYFAAGADIATTASYQATFEGFSRFGVSEDEASQLMQLSVRLAREARDQFWTVAARHQRRLRPLVAASVGSYGAFLADGSEYRGDYALSAQTLKDFHRRRVEDLLEAAPDLLAFETVPCLMEGEVLVDLMSEFREVRAWLSYSCCDEEHVCHGERFRDCVELVNQSEQILAVGVNCTSPRLVEALLRNVRGATDKYLVAYPNSGEGWDSQHRCWIEVPNQMELGIMARRWYAAGARLIGGCCRTTPRDIHSIAGEFDRAQ